MFEAIYADSLGKLHRSTAGMALCISTLFSLISKVLFSLRQRYGTDPASNVDIFSPSTILFFIFTN